MTLTVSVLGPVSVERRGRPVALGGPKVRVLLAVLASQHGRVLSIDRLCDALWGEDQPAAPVATLQSHLSRLRRTIEPEATVAARPPGYALVGDDLAIDAARFEVLAREPALDDGDGPDGAASRLGEALALWRGPAYGEHLDCPLLLGEAARLDELRLSTTERWIDARLALADPAVVGDLERLVAEHPLRERFWCQLMLGLHRQGRQVEALRRAHELHTRLRDEFGLSVSADALALEARIRADDPTLRPGRDAPTRTGNRRRSDRRTASSPDAARAIAEEPNTLVGRDDDLAALTDLVDGARLVSLVGPGGVGKTRLARRLAVVAGGELPTPPAFVELAAVGDPDAVLDAIGTALDVQRRQHRTLADTLVDVLGDRAQLIVLDNCEHVLDVVCAVVEPMVRQCPQLHVVTTSRQPLGLPGELVYTVRPLTVAAEGVDGLGRLALVDASPALQLFLDRAAAARPGFVATDANVEALAELCRRLDGLPLALELAAARLRSIGPDAMLERLDQRFKLLAAAPHHAQARHRTLTDLVAWSYDLLTDREQQVFRRLSVLAGSFGLPAAEALGGEADALEVVLDLVDRSMVQVTDPDEPRYQLLETLREFGRDRLVAAGSVGRVRDAHLDWFLGFAEEAAVGLTGPDEAAWSRRLDRDFDDLRAAHAHAVQLGDADRALRLVASLREFSFRRIRYEVTTWAATSVELPGAAEHPRYPVVLAVVAYGHFVRGDLEAAVETGLAAIAAGERLGVGTSGLAERTLGNAIFYLGRPDEAIGWMAAMVDDARAGGSPARLAHALYMSSVAETSVGRAVRGAVLAGEARAAADVCGAPTARAQAMYALGLALESTDAGESFELLRASAELAAGAGNRWIEAFARTEVSWLEARRGDPLAGLAQSAGVIESWYHGGDWANQWLSLRHVFGILDQLGDHHAAAVLHGALTAAGAAYALPFEPADAERLDAMVLTLRTELGPEAFADAVREGAALPDASLVAFVLRRITTLTDP